MKKILTIKQKSFVLSILTILCLALTCLHLHAQQVLPQPTTVVMGDSSFSLNANTTLYLSSKGKESTSLLSYIRSTTSFPLHSGKHGKKRNAIRLLLTGWHKEQEVLRDVYLQSYELCVDEGGIEIKSPSMAGLFYGWQSVRQLLDEQGCIKFCKINDVPLLPYRGVMIDCSRHFWSIEHLKRQIDVLATIKINRLHLHLTDAGGWRMEIKKYPNLVRQTAFRTASNWGAWWESGLRTYCQKEDDKAYGGFYTQQELKNLVRYAADRHISIIPEIEMPGHSEEVTFAYPWLSCFKDGRAASDLCVGKESTFRFLEDVLNEVMQVFPSELIHIGGDEAQRKTWETCPHCQQRMREENITTTAQLQAYLTNRVGEYLNRHGRKMLGWDEIIEGELSAQACVMAWRGEDAGIRAAQMGHKVIMSPSEYCYIDTYQDAPSSQPAAFGGYIPLDKIFSYDPIPKQLRGKSEEQLIFGVQANLWTEMVETPKHLEYMLYPRVMAIAEIGWSRQKTSYANFRKRTLEVLKQMQSQGYTPFNLEHEIGHRHGVSAPVRHAAKDKQVNYLTPYYPSYKAAGERSLTDGYCGDWNFNDGHWQGFIGDNGFEVVIDLEKSIILYDISLDFMQFVGPGIFFPSKIEISVSENGKNYSTLCSESFDFENTYYFIRTYEWRGKSKGRYIRCKAERSTQKGWLFTNEILINRSSYTHSTN